jgi:hypothetical protein
MGCRDAGAARRGSSSLRACRSRSTCSKRSARRSAPRAPTSSPCSTGRKRSSSGFSPSLEQSRRNGGAVRRARWDRKGRSAEIFPQGRNTPFLAQPLAGGRSLSSGGRRRRSDRLDRAATLKRCRPVGAAGSVRLRRLEQLSCLGDPRLANAAAAPGPWRGAGLAFLVELLRQRLDGVEAFALGQGAPCIPLPVVLMISDSAARRSRRRTRRREAQRSANRRLSGWPQACGDPPRASSAPRFRRVSALNRKL